MKFFISLVIVVLCTLKNFVETNEYSVGFESHLKMLAEMRMRSKTFLEKLYITANKMDKKEESFLDSLERSYLMKHSSEFQQERNHRNDPYSGNRFSKIPKERIHHRNISQFEYREYRNMTLTLKQLAKDYPELVKVTTAQKEFGLPHPEGKCKGAKCTHFIVRLTNHSLDTSNMPQIYISGEVHGDERVGPTATIELIKLMVENSKNPWFNHLLNTRLIVITPMTNPHGYATNNREETVSLGEEESKKFLIRLAGTFQATRDINRDFPYLVDEDKCMQTIGARVVNELYLKHLFSLALTLHGGTESLTYPYGAPNHIVGNPTIPMDYKMVNGKLQSKETTQTKAFIKKIYDIPEGRNGNSTLPPDILGIRAIAKTAQVYTSNDPKHRYPIGSMSNVVYPVRGGMEDWAYGGGWEGYPIINQCSPTTYPNAKKYSKDRTNYKGKEDALKSIMFLLESSGDKSPEMKFLGRKSLDCLINLKHNAFFNTLTKDQDICLDNLVDGYIPRVIRLSLSLIDLLEPYVNFDVSVDNKDNKIKIKWIVGGALSVDKTFVLYDYVDKQKAKNIEKKAIAAKNNEDLLKVFKFKSKLITNRNAIWNPNFNQEQDVFKYDFKFPPQDKILVYLIFAKVDSNWGNKINADPLLNPQTHIVNQRTNNKYTAKNGKYSLRGQSIFKSDLGIAEREENQVVVRRVR